MRHCQNVVQAAAETIAPGTMECQQRLWYPWTSGPGITGRWKLRLCSPSLATFQEAFGPHRAEIVADVANYTDIAPIVQISEIVGG